MIRTAFLVAAISLAALPAIAQDVNEIEGLYTGSGEGDLTLDLTHIENDRYSISINTVVPIQEEFMGCAGGIDGEVLLSAEGGNFFVENESYDPKDASPLNQRYCEIGIIFDGQGGVTLEERDGCLEYHGASCGFSGNLIHDGAAG
jgi:hypothetical protein